MKVAAPRISKIVQIACVLRAMKMYWLKTKKSKRLFNDVSKQQYDGTHEVASSAVLRRFRPLCGGRS